MMLGVIGSYKTYGIHKLREPRIARRASRCWGNQRSTSQNLPPAAILTWCPDLDPDTHAVITLEPCSMASAEGESVLLMSRTQIWADRESRPAASGNAHVSNNRDNVSDLVHPLHDNLLLEKRRKRPSEVVAAEGGELCSGAVIGNVSSHKTSRCLETISCLSFLPATQWRPSPQPEPQDAENVHVDDYHESDRISPEAPESAPTAPHITRDGANLSPLHYGFAYLQDMRRSNRASVRSIDDKGNFLNPPASVHSISSSAAV